MPIASINPATGETIEVFAAHDADEIERRITQAADAARILRQSTTFAQRAQWMNASADLLEADLDDRSRTLTLEMGKPITQAREEVHKCAHAMRFYAANAQRFLAGEILDDPTAVGA